MENTRRKEVEDKEKKEEDDIYRSISPPNTYEKMLKNVRQEHPLFTF